MEVLERLLRDALHYGVDVSTLEGPTPAVGQHAASPGERTPDSAVRSPGAVRAAAYRARKRARQAGVTGVTTGHDASRAVTPSVTEGVSSSVEPKGSTALEKDASTPYIQGVTPGVTGVTPASGGAIPSTLRGIAPVGEFTLSPPEPVAPRTKKPPRPVSPRHAPLKAALLAAYREIAGTDYPALWVKDAPAIGRLVEMCPDNAAVVEAWKRSVTLAPTYPNTRSIAVFASRLPDLLGKSSASRPLTPQDDRMRRAPVRAGDVDWSRT